MKKPTQESQVLAALRKEGGAATLRRLNEILDFSTWATKTPEASVRRIVQNCKEIFKIRPGLWALEECRAAVLSRFKLKPGDAKSEEAFTHGYYQGLLVEIGKLRHWQTYVPAQDRNRLFVGKALGDIADTTEIPAFTNERILRRARSVDVIWFNGRGMPTNFYEVEHTTDIRNSLSKFYELQDFHAGFAIVADKSRRREYEDKIAASIFDSIAGRVEFLDYERIACMHESVSKTSALEW